MYKGGYTGKILRINLTGKAYTIEDLPGETAKKFIGGAGFASRPCLTKCRPKQTPWDLKTN